VGYNEAKTTSKCIYPISAAVIESDTNVNVPQPPTTFKCFVAEYCEQTITETKLLTSWYMNFLAKKHVWVSNMVGKTENFFTFLSLWYDKRFHFRIAYLPLSFDVAECVISRDEHEYCGITMRHWFLLKRWGPSNNCASGPLKASPGTVDL